MLVQDCEVADAVRTYAWRLALHCDRPAATPCSTCHFWCCINQHMVAELEPPKRQGRLQHVEHGCDLWPGMSVASRAAPNYTSQVGPTCSCACCECAGMHQLCSNYPVHENDAITGTCELQLHPDSMRHAGFVLLLQQH
jgi:hypothetical protein